MKFTTVLLILAVVFISLAASQFLILPPGPFPPPFPPPPFPPFPPTFPPLPPPPPPPPPPRPTNFLLRPGLVFGTGGFFATIFWLLAFRTVGNVVTTGRLDGATTTQSSIPMPVGVGK